MKNGFDLPILPWLTELRFQLFDMPGPRGGNASKSLDPGKKNKQNIKKKKAKENRQSGKSLALITDESLCFRLLSRRFPDAAGWNQPRPDGDNLF